MKIVTYNIQFGLGKDGRFDLERVAAEVDGADIIALQEVERHWQRSGNIDQAAQLGQILNKYYWVYGPYFDVDASSSQPDGSIKNVRRQFGNMILSKTPILSTRLFPLPKSALRQRHNMVVGVFEGVVKLRQDGALRIYNAHLGARSQLDRVAQIASIRETIRRAPAEGGAWTGELAHNLWEHHAHNLWEEDATPPPMPESFVLLGDFNLESKDPEYDYLVGPRDGDLGRLSSKEEFIDTWVATGHDEDEGVTYSADSSVIEDKGMRIDYTFVDQSMQKRVLGAWIDKTAQGSDHQPYWIELDYAPNV
ncbi:MAG TPA: endonuclease [Deltaproteobacteria bacterium]|jgi:endonuclease/exonuclease/phosphatase family metal-dependent hydrolase|nr:endonuclease/exonuclease/phosphatase family protein [SAR324 cluster bacterium]HIN47303.1 endonuclease [Deltaproteobacteria bacterium]